jgi:hypothetical protein
MQLYASINTAAAGSLATSILALSHAGPVAISATALGTSTILAGTSIYTKEFLFASENIDSVRTLTMNALYVHQELFRAKITEPLDIYDAVIALLDDQAICTLPHIATLVRSAIKNANPEQSPRPDKVGQGSSGLKGTADLTTPISNGSRDLKQQ